MPWVNFECLLKGLFLGLLAYAAIVAESAGAAAIVCGLMLLGLIVGLCIGARSAHGNGVRPSGHWAAYFLFLLFEYPRPIEIGIVAGLAIGVLLLRGLETDAPILLIFLGGGISIGLLLLTLSWIRHRIVRLTTTVAIAVAIVLGVVFLSWWMPGTLPDEHRRSTGLNLLLGLPFFYLLAFIGESEESDADAAAWCAALAISVWLIRISSETPWLGLLIPIALFHAYTSMVLPGLRVFKHTLRGISYGQVGLHGDALRALSRAMQIDPNNDLARSALWQVHRRLDPLAIDDELMPLIDAQACMARVEQLLNEPPNAAQRSEATRLLDLAERRDVRLRPRILYWRAVAAAHAGDLDSASSCLNTLFDSTDSPERQSTLLDAWQLALLLHPGLEARVGREQLQKPGRRLEAIAEVERALAAVADDPKAWSLKRVLYAPLTLKEFQAGPAREFDFAYCEQLGIALIDEPERLSRAVEFLAMAAAGQPLESPRLWHAIANAWMKRGDWDAAMRACQQGKLAGLQVGHKQLPDASRHAFFSMLKTLADDAERTGSLDAAAESLSLFAEYERSGIESLRALADLHERRGDPLAALNAVERARLFDAKDTDLLARRDKYVYSIDPSALRQASESLRKSVDVDYCVGKAKQLLEVREADAELLHWANHLAELALVLLPQGCSARLLAARVRLRRGERDSALQLLEDIREQQPAKFTNSTEEEAWWMANRVLADLYLDELDRPDLAVACLQEFRKSSKSGADTLYKLGLAHERMDERKKAASFYELAASYEGHPLAAEAREGLRRVR